MSRLRDMAIRLGSLAYRLRQVEIAGADRDGTTARADLDLRHVELELLNCEQILSDLTDRVMADRFSKANSERTRQTRYVEAGISTGPIPASQQPGRYANKAPAEWLAKLRRFELDHQQHEETFGPFETCAHTRCTDARGVIRNHERHVESPGR